MSRLIIPFYTEFPFCLFTYLCSIIWTSFALYFLFPTPYIDCIGVWLLLEGKKKRKTKNADLFLPFHWVFLWQLQEILTIKVKSRTQKSSIYAKESEKKEKEDT